MAFATALKNLDLTSIINDVRTEIGLNDEDAARAEELYRHFLALCYKYPEQKVVPPKLADYVWHEHITHTRKYAEDCERMFGEFVHHTPSKANLGKEYEETKQLYKKEFQIDLEQYGLAPELIAASDCSN